MYQKRAKGVLGLLQAAAMPCGESAVAVAVVAGACELQPASAAAARTVTAAQQAVALPWRTLNGRIRAIRTSG
jgi:hypothetical protein